MTTAYNFYYDESEHSRKITYETIHASNYYDNFIAVIVGWPVEQEGTIFQKYKAFENKYCDRKNKEGEIKSTTISAKQFKYGFASLDHNNARFVSDFLSIFDENCKLYFSVMSKIEHLICQIFNNYQNELFIDADAIKYIVTKALVIYRPEKVIQCIYGKPRDFVNELKIFLRERIEFNKLNLHLKQMENDAFERILNILDDVSTIQDVQWDYHIPFDGFLQYLQEENIEKYTLCLDKEGKNDRASNTLQAAYKKGLCNVTETDSQDSYGLRIADMMAGIISRMLKALCNAKCYNSDAEVLKKKMLDPRWFTLNEEQFELYRKLHKIICKWDNAWYKAISGIYGDNLVSFVSLLRYMNNFEDLSQFQNDKQQTHSDRYNEYNCQYLNNYFDQMKNKLPIEPISLQNNDYFINHHGAKVYNDITKQAVFQVTEGSQTVNVLSVGMYLNIPLITISYNNKPLCCRLPEELYNWAYTAIAIATKGENLFPAQVVFTRHKNKYFADIL